MDETEDQTMPLSNVDVEVNQLLGLFDVPAFVRRGQDLEYALARLHDRCRRQRDALLDMVRVRLRQWAAAANGPECGSLVFASPIAELWPLCGAEVPAWAPRPASLRRQRAIARDLVASVERFNRRWSHYLEGLPLDHANGLIEHYNRYYLFEKECSLGSSRLAARFYSPRPHISRESLRDDYPPLPVPELRD